MIMAKVFLGLGSNLGNKKDNLLKAVTNIEEKIGKVTSLSSFYETEPWGFKSDNSFLMPLYAWKHRLNQQPFSIL